MDIHPTARVHENAKLGEGVTVAANASIGPGVEIGDGCRIDENASIRGPLVMGAKCTVGHCAAIGHDPHISGSDGPFGATRIGARNVFREFTTVHRSMFPDKETVVGDDGYFMASAHVGHDCIVGDRVILCNTTALGGHVTVEDRAFLSANTVVHQFARVGEFSMIGGLTALQQDAPPFCMVAGMRPARLQGLNVVGMRRGDVPADVRTALKAAYRKLFRSDAPLPERLAAVDRSVAEVDRLVRFIEESPRGVTGFGGRA